MAVALVHEALGVGRGGQASGTQAAGVPAQAHGAALGRDPLLLLEQADDGPGRFGVELGGVGPLPAADVAREFGDHHLQAQAEAEVGNALLAGVAGGGDLALPAALPEAARHDDAVHARQHGLGGARLQILRVHPADADLGVEPHAGVHERLLHGEVGILQLHVLADERHLEEALGVALALDHRLPGRQVVGPLLQSEPLEHEVAEPEASRMRGTA